MVADVIRDSASGHIVRLLSRNKHFRYPEEIDPSIASRYFNAEKSANMAKYGQVTSSEAETKVEEKGMEPVRLYSSKDRSTACSLGCDGSDTTTVAEDVPANSQSGAPVDPEKGRDVIIVDWDGPDDPEVGNESFCMSIIY